MGYRLEVLLTAEIEVAIAVEYYLEISETLAEKFLDDVESVYDDLRNLPYFQKRYRNIRGLPLKKFPYLLLFIVDEDNKTVEILSCFHTSRNPKKYPK